MGNRHHLTESEIPAVSHSIAQPDGSPVVGIAFPPGTKMLIQQTSIPIGWSKDTDASAMLPEGFIALTKD